MATLPALPDPQVSLLICPPFATVMLSALILTAPALPAFAITSLLVLLAMPVN